MFAICQGGEGVFFFGINQQESKIKAKGEGDGWCACEY